MPKLLLFAGCLWIIMIANAQQPKLFLPIGHTYFVENACFSPDGQKVLTASADQTAKIWDAESGTLLANLKGHTAAVGCARFSPNGKKIVTASTDGTAKIWNTENGSLLFDLKSQKKDKYQPIYDACFSPDSRKVLSTSTEDDVIAKIWDSETGTLLMELKRKNSFALNAFFSPDGEKIVTSDAGMNADIWDAQSGALLGELQGSIFWINSYCFSPDGKKIVNFKL